MNKEHLSGRGSLRLLLNCDRSTAILERELKWVSWARQPEGSLGEEMLNPQLGIPTRPASLSSWGRGWMSRFAPFGFRQSTGDRLRGSRPR